MIENLQIPNFALIFCGQIDLMILIIKSAALNHSTLDIHKRSEINDINQTLKITNLLFEIRDFEYLVDFDAWSILLLSLTFR